MPLAELLAVELAVELARELPFVLPWLELLLFWVCCVDFLLFAELCLLFLVLPNKLDTPLTNCLAPFFEDFIFSIFLLLVSSKKISIECALALMEQLHMSMSTFISTALSLLPYCLIVSRTWRSLTALMTKIGVIMKIKVLVLQIRYFRSIPLPASLCLGGSPCACSSFRKLRFVGEGCFVSLV